MSILFPRKAHAFRSLTDVVYRIPVKVTATLFQSGRCLLFFFLKKVVSWQTSACARSYRRGLQPRSRTRRVTWTLWNAQARLCTFGSKTKGNIGRCSSSSSVWTHKPLLCLLPACTAASNSWAVSVEAQIWSCHWTYRTLFILRIRGAESNGVGADSLNWLPVQESGSGIQETESLQGDH